MKLKTYFMAISVIFLLVVILSSCNMIGNDEPIEYWKAKVGVDILQEDYLENRFNSIVSNPNEYQLAYFDLAKFTLEDIIILGFDINETNEDFPKREVEKIVRTIAEGTCPGIACESNLIAKGSRIKCSQGHTLFYKHLFTQKVYANIKSHPELYIENASKIIGTIDDLRNYIRDHVKVKDLRSKTVGGFKRYQVLYEIQSKKEPYYKICTIIVKDDKHSTLTVEYSNSKINNIVDMWELSDF